MGWEAFMNRTGRGRYGGRWVFRGCPHTAVPVGRLTGDQIELILTSVWVIGTAIGVIGFGVRTMFVLEVLKTPIGILVPLFYFHEGMGVPLTVLGIAAASIFVASHLRGATAIAPLIGVAIFALSCLIFYHDDLGAFIDTYVTPNIWMVPLAFLGIVVLTYPMAFVLQWFENHGTYQPKRDENGDIIVDSRYLAEIHRPEFQSGRRRRRHTLPCLWCLTGGNRTVHRILSERRCSRWQSMRSSAIPGNPCTAIRGT